MNERSHKKLAVWHKSMALVTAVYSIARKFPKEETYGLGSQIRRASVSIPSNLAEGHAMKNTSHYLRYIYIARGSLAELETQLTIASNLNYVSQDELKPLFEEIDDIGRMLSKLVSSLNEKIARDATFENIAQTDNLTSTPQSLTSSL